MKPCKLTLALELASEGELISMDVAPAARSGLALWPASMGTSMSSSAALTERLDLLTVGWLPRKDDIKFRFTSRALSD